MEASAGFNFTAHIRLLCQDMVTRLPDLRHIDLDRVAIRYCQARTRARHGILASLTPLRFESGSLYTRKRGRQWTIQRILDASGRDMLYLLSFYLPRFMEYPLEEKLATVIHELWHISPRFDGDLRRHPGRCYAHTSSQREYDAQMQQLTAAWLALDPPASLYSFLQYSFRELAKRHGPVYGVRMAVPRLLPVESAA